MAWLANKHDQALERIIMTDKPARHSGMISQFVRVGTAAAWALVTTLTSTLAIAGETLTISPKNPPTTLNFTVLPDGTIQGQKALSVTITRTEKNSAVMQSCDKIDMITIDATTGYSTRKAGWLYFFNHPLCNFTKKLTYYPFSDDTIRGRCVGIRSHTIKSQISIFLWDGLNGANHVASSRSWGHGAVAHINCENNTAPQKSPAANVHPVNNCRLSGNWTLWEAAPGHLAAIPFVLTANQGRSDVYQVGTPNRAGVTGAALVNGYHVTASLQSGNGAQMQSFSGSFNRSCSSLSGQAVRSDAPISLTARHSGGGYTPQSVHSSRTQSAPVKTRPQPARTTPHLNSRVAPKWNLR